MINLLDNIINLNLIEIKLNVPQVGAEIIDYVELNDFNSDELYDFVIDKFGVLRIGRGHYKLNNKDKYLYFAGRLKIKNGKIIYIDNDSGHYYPSKENLNNLIRVLSSSEHVSKKLIYEYVNLDSIYKELE